MRRTLIKVIGRYRISGLRFLGIRHKPYVGVIGTGQCAFATICYFIKINKGLVFLNCYDIDYESALSLSRYYCFKSVANDVTDVLADGRLKVLYIASNHASHTDYAVQAMESSIPSIYIEKPIAVSYAQFYKLITTQRRYKTNLYAGYNRPYSKAVILIRNTIQSNYENVLTGAFSLNCFISGHFLAKDHWYRKPREGTRICGNMGHWLDLAIHILAWRSIPDLFKIQISYSSKDEIPDDNLAVTLVSGLGDIINIFLGSRSEPFEGINETINLLYLDTIAKIDDFREVKIWRSEKLIKKRYFPKDVGHERAVMQPFKKSNRAWREVEISTLLMLKIADMVRDSKREYDFSVKDEMAALKNISNADM